MKAPTSAAGWRALIDDFAKQAEAVELQITEAKESKRPLAVAALSGDADARAKVVELDRKAFELAAQAETIDIATVQARDALAACEHSEAVAAEVAHVSRIVDMARERDEAGKEVAKAADALHAALRTLHRVGGELGQALGDADDGDRRLVAGTCSPTLTVAWDRRPQFGLAPIGYTHLKGDDNGIVERAEQRIQWRSENPPTRIRVA